MASWTETEGKAIRLHATREIMPEVRENEILPAAILSSAQSTFPGQHLDVDCVFNSCTCSTLTNMAALAISHADLPEIKGISSFEGHFLQTDTKAE